MSVSRSHEYVHNNIVLRSCAARHRHASDNMNLVRQLASIHTTSAFRLVCVECAKKKMRGDHHRLALLTCDAVETDLQVGMFVWKAKS